MNIKPFVGWCLEHGIQSPLEIKVNSDGYRYTVFEDADRSSSSDEQLLVQCPLTMSIIEPTKEELADRLVSERQKGSQSLFAPYIDILPKTFDDLPRFWDPTLIQDTISDGGALMNVVQDHQRRSQTDAAAWAMACVDSRANLLPNGSYALTPMLDMINHDGSVSTRATLESDQLSLFAHVPTTKATIRQGLFSFFGGGTNANTAEVKISYGPLTNLQTLADYGFVESNNPHNREVIWVNMIRRAPVKVTIGPDGSVDRTSVCNILTNLSLASELDFIIGKADSFHSRRNEIEGYALILGYLEEAISDAETISPTVMPVLLKSYMTARQRLLEKATEKIQKALPELSTE